MSKKADKRAQRLAAALWREFCDSWVAIGQAADREWRMLRERRTSERPRMVTQGRLAAVQLMSIATMLGGSGCCAPPMFPPSSTSRYRGMHPGQGARAAGRPGW